MRLEKWKPRLKPSARQKGSDVAAGAAARTSTSLWVMRWTCQFCVPRLKVCPTVASQTNSSSSSPIRAPESAWRSW